MEGQVSDTDKAEEEQKKISALMSTVVKSCPICLTIVSNRSLTDTCLHEFCFDCIHQWSQNHNRCPVCRQIYRNVVHNIVSKDLFDEMPVEDRPEEMDTPMAELIQRMFLILRVISVRNRSMRERDQLLETLSESNDRTIQVEQMERDVQKLTTDIDQMTTVLNSEEPTDEELTSAINGSVENYDDFFEVIDAFVQPIAQELDNESMPPLEPMDEDEGNEADNEFSDYEVEDEEFFDEEEDEDQEMEIQRVDTKRRHSDSDEPQEDKRSRNL